MHGSKFLRMRPQREEMPIGFTRASRQGFGARDAGNMENALILLDLGGYQGHRKGFGGSLESLRRNPGGRLLTARYLGGTCFAGHLFRSTCFGYLGGTCFGHLFRQAREYSLGNGLRPD
jgi:hypothetical protein